MQIPSNPCKHGQRTLNEDDDDDDLASSNYSYITPPGFVFLSALLHWYVRCSVDTTSLFYEYESAPMIMSTIDNLNKNRHISYVHSSYFHTSRIWKQAERTQHQPSRLYNI